MNRRSAGPLTHAAAITSPPIVPEPRRTVSTSKLSGLFKTDDAKASDSKLNEALDAMSLAQKLRIKAAETERRGGAKLAEWARKTKNAAISDVIEKTSSVLQMHSDLTVDLALRNQQTTGLLRGLCGRGRELEETEKEYRRLKEKEARLQKELNQRRDRTRAQQDALEAQLSDTKRQISFTWEHLRRLRGDEEAVKMLRLRHGCKGFADAGLNYTTAARAIFSTQRELAESIPGLAVPGDEVFGLTYDAIPFTQEKIEQLRHFLDSLQKNDGKICIQHSQERSQLLGGPRRRSEPARRAAGFGHHPRAQQAAAAAAQSIPASPPPPYTPSAPAGEMNTSTSSNSSSGSCRPSNNRLSHPSAPQATPLARNAANPLRASFLQPIRNEDYPSAIAQLTASAERKRENRRSLPPACGGCVGRLYPELPTNY
ncbi:unnamed protein product, partial [Mesorhabditis spiculigera]